MPDNVPIQKRTYFKRRGVKAQTVRGYSVYVDVSWPPLEEWSHTLPDVKGDAHGYSPAHGYPIIRLDHLYKWVEFEIDDMWMVEPGDIVLPSGLDPAPYMTEKFRPIARVEGWNDQTFRQWALDCTERVLPVIEEKFPRNYIVRSCLRVSRQHMERKNSINDVLRLRNDVYTLIRKLQEAHISIYDKNRCIAVATAAADVAYAVAYKVHVSNYCQYAAENAALALLESGDSVLPPLHSREWQARHLAKLLGLPWEDES